MKKRKYTVPIIMLAALLVIGIGIGIYAVYYNQYDHMGAMTEKELYEYNYVLTAFGRSASITASNEVLILDTMTKKLGGDTEVTFKIYRYEKESDLADALYMTNQEIGEASGYTYMGHGTVTLGDDSYAGMRDMEVFYLR